MGRPAAGAFRAKIARSRGKKGDFLGKIAVFRGKMAIFPRKTAISLLQLSLHCVLLSREFSRFSGTHGPHPHWETRDGHEKEEL